MITLIADNKQIPVKWTEFSDGALTCKVDVEALGKDPKNIWLTVAPTTPCKQVLEEVNLIIDVLFRDTRLQCAKLNLNLPYLPYGRGDRVFEKGNPHPLQLFFSLILYANFYEIVVDDPHSKFIENLHSTCNASSKALTINSQLDCLKQATPKVEASTFDYILAPDKGAVEKATTIAKAYNLPLLTANKVRNISTGRIESVELNTKPITGGRVLIVDDILDGGGTFLPLAEELQSLGCNCSLYVTHLIAAKGLDIFKDRFTSIHYKNIVGKYINATDVLNFNNGA